MNPSMNEIYYSLSGIQLHVVQAGPENGRPVILLHGFPEFWYGWKHQIGPLAGHGFRVLAPDQRGYNTSDKPKELKAYQLDELAQDVLGLISASGNQKAAIIGHDWGGMVAWWLGMRYPERVEKLGILNAPHPAVFKKTLMSNSNQMLRSLYAAFFQIPFLPEAALRKQDWEPLVQTMRETSRGGYSGSKGAFTDQDFEQYRRAWWMKEAMTSMLNWYRAALRLPPNLEGDLHVHVPTLILWGVQDHALSPQMAQESIDMCDQGRLICFDEATHWLQHEEVGQVNDLLIQFLE